MTNFYRFLCSALLVTGLSIQLSVGQKTQVYEHAWVDYLEAIELFDKEKYGAAQTFFDRAYAKANDPHSEIASDASYYAAVCAMHLFNRNAEDRLVEFIGNYPESPKVQKACFQLGNYQYRKRQYRMAIHWFNEVDIYLLSNDEIGEYYFKLGYSYFKTDQYKDAKQAFFEIKDAETQYREVAKYYYAHIAYEEDNNETALKNFRELEGDEKFSSVVPFYITQILFEEEDYEELLNYAPRLLDSANTKRAAEIARMIGESHYRLEQFEEATPYLEQAVKGGGAGNQMDHYQLGYCYMKQERYADAVPWLQKSMTDNDSLNQVIYYHLAKNFLMQDEKRRARNSFKSAATTGADKELAEESAYNYAKLSYELSFHPFNDAIRAFEDYINSYPNSKRFDEANEYLVGVYFTTKNYKEAKASLERIEQRSLKLNLAYQRILYYLGIESFKKRRYKEALSHFESARNENFEPSIAVDALFWKSESYFRLLEYRNSATSYQEFLSLPGSRSSEYYALANYNMAYASFRTRDYTTAITWFRNYISLKDEATMRMTNDALLRVGDSYFVMKQFKDAIEYYDKAVLLGQFEIDYALYQSAVANGVVGNYDDKINLLRTLTGTYSLSVYYDDGLYELADILMIKGVNNEARSTLDKLLEEKPQSPYKGKASLKLGLLNFNEERDDEALELFRYVVSNHRGTPESKEAIAKIKQIYINRSDLAGFESYMANLGVEDLSTQELDSAAYEIAENAYLNGDCEAAVKNLTTYLDRYDQGNFRLNAHYYRGECELKSGFENEALIDFEQVLAQPKNIFTEKSLLAAAGIRSDLGDHSLAIALYERLEQEADLQANVDLAHYELMKLNYKAGREDRVIHFAQTLLNKDKLSDEIKGETYFLLGKVYLKMDDFNGSYKAFDTISSMNNAWGAESKYQLAYIEYLRGNTEKSEQQINRLLNQVPSYDEWIAMAFILWSDIYISREDLFQAKVSLQSVIENYQGRDLVERAQAKLQSIEKIEEAQKQETQQQEDIQIDLTEDEEDYDYLFEEEIEEEHEAIP